MTWYSVSDSLPDPGVRVLVWCAGDALAIARLNHASRGMFWECDAGKPAPAVTHWAGLPNGPTATPPPEPSPATQD
jgi:hypothetical protein